MPDTIKKKKVMLLTSHVWDSDRKAGFHWLADGFLRQDWEVYFVTGLTTIDKFKKDYRIPFLSKYGKNKFSQPSPYLHSYIFYNLYRPANFKNKWLNLLFTPLFNLYQFFPLGDLKKAIAHSDLFIFESTQEIMLFRSFKKINSSAKYIYRISDDMKIRNTHPVILQFEDEVVNKFDLISVPTESIYNRFSNLDNIKLQLHGIPTHLYEKNHKNPYKNNTLNAIFIGNNFFDDFFLSTAANLFPNINFHIIGPITLILELNNVYFYGEMPYEKTIPFVKYADIALSPMLLPSFADSNKIVQYTHCKLPIIISSINFSDRENFIYYDIGDEATIKTAINKALDFNPNKVTFKPCRNWDDLVNEILEDI